MDSFCLGAGGRAESEESVRLRRREKQGSSRLMVACVALSSIDLFVRLKGVGASRT